MSRPIFENVFSFESRLNRAAYLKLIIVMMGVMLVAGALTWGGDELIAYIFASTDSLFVRSVMALIYSTAALVVWVLIGLVIYCAAFQRCNDIGLSRLWPLGMGIMYMMLLLDLKIASMLGRPDMVEQAMIGQGMMEQAMIGQGGAWAVVLGVIFAIGAAFDFYLFFKPGQNSAKTVGPNPLDGAD